ncbi:TMAO reductase system periplasmic protein TorT [Alcaligenaceae bacterium SJ-26]|nr:TMAO reductase system periplasmic protein TorT [Alcaligenaceae bacterium SJ-26]
MKHKDTMRTFYPRARRQCLAWPGQRLLWRGRQGLLAALVACCGGMLVPSTVALAADTEQAEAWPLRRWQGPERDTSPVLPQRQPASRAWQVCAIYPHLKDGYWLAVNYGMMEEAARLGVGISVAGAGGYNDLAMQRRQVAACAADPQIDGMLLGTVSYDGLGDLLTAYAAAHPVVALVNDVGGQAVQGRVGVPWYELGRETGQWLAQRHPAGSGPVTVAWFLGPRDAGWVLFLDAGFRDAIAGSDVTLATVQWGDTGRSVQRQLVEDVLDTHPDLRYLVGNAVMAEVAVSELHHRGWQDRVGIVSAYMTPGVYRSLARGSILAAATDFPVLQGRLAVQQILARLEGRPSEPYVGPDVALLERDQIQRFPAQWTVPPAGFNPVFQVEPMSGPQ